MLSFLNDDRATMEIQMRLVIYVIIMASIVAIAITGLQSIRPGMTSDIMEKEMGKLGSSLNAMQTGAARNLIDTASPNGNMRTFMITIPDDVDYLAFGVDPDPDNDNNLTNTREGLVTEKGNVIFYQAKSGKIRIPLDDTVELREGMFENGRWVLNDANGKQYGAVIPGSGKFEMSFEMVYDPVSRKRYTLSHFTDRINAYINPYDPAALPNSIWVSVDPNSIPADGVTDADVIIQLKDSMLQKKGLL